MYIHQFVYIFMHIYVYIRKKQASRIASDQVLKLYSRHHPVPATPKLQPVICYNLYFPRIYYIHAVSVSTALAYVFEIPIIQSAYLGLVSALRGGDQHLERPNVEPPIFRNFEISNIKITKVHLFDFSIFKFIF